jgi:hypothetical protein
MRFADSSAVAFAAFCPAIVAARPRALPKRKRRG